MQPSAPGPVTVGDHSVFLYDFIEQVPVSDWLTCNADHNFFLTPAYLKACEKSLLPGLQVRYAVVHDNNGPIAAMYFQASNLSDAGLGGVLNLEDYGMVAGAITSKINSFLFEPGEGKSSHLLVCGNLLVSGDHGIAAINTDAFQVALTVLEPILKHLTSGFPPGKKVVAWMGKDFGPDRDGIAAKILSASFFRLNTDPVMILHVPPEWTSFEDYINALSSKYRVRANNSLAKSKSVKERNLDPDEIKKREKEINDLLAQVISKAPVKLVRPAASYFIELKIHFGPHYDFRGLFVEDRMVGFISGLWDKLHYEAHYIGIDYNLNKELGIYQSILYSFINDAINRGSRNLYFGRTALEIKSTVGARPVNMGCYLKLNNKIFHALARPLIGSTGPGSWIPRDPFRKENS
jgi:hypothetical protein